MTNIYFKEWIRSTKHVLSTGQFLKYFIFTIHGKKTAFINIVSAVLMTYTCLRFVLTKKL